MFSNKFFNLIAVGLILYIIYGILTASFAINNQIAQAQEPIRKTNGEISAVTQKQF